ncbi:MAG: CDP-glycerol glycerophosphotransferase family protein, partial [Lentisphaeraceae bacterium]|nr:CDP-glycerol glycerophosphotransferase family protein [Lentisphaeraceae bacterium]
MIEIENSDLVFFTKSYQSVPPLAQIQRLAGGNFVCGRKNTSQLFEQHYNDLPLVRYSKINPWSKGVKCLRNAKIIVTGSPYRSILSEFKAKKYMAFHGTYMMLSRDAATKNSHFDHLFVTGPRMKQMLGRYQDEFNFSFSETGFLPFSEFPEKTAMNKMLLMKKFNLDEEKKNIIYCASRKRTGSWHFEAENILNDLSEHYNIILRPHPAQAMNGDKEDRQLFKKLQKESKNRRGVILDIMKYRLPDLLSIADLVISDSNSPAEESLFYDVPQLLVEGPNMNRDVIVKMAKEEHMHPDDTEGLLNMYKCALSYNYDGFKNWKDAVEESFKKAEDFKPARQKYFDWVFGQRDRLAAN